MSPQIKKTKPVSLDVVFRAEKSGPFKGAIAAVFPTEYERRKTETLFLNPSASAQMLIAGGLTQDEAFAELVRLKETAFCVRYDKTSYFDPRELRRLISFKAQEY